MPEVKISLKDGNNILSVTGSTVVEVGGVLREASKNPDFAVFFGPTPAGQHPASDAVQKIIDEKKAEAATGLTGDDAVTAAEAQALVTKHLGPTEEAASAALIKVAAKASGKTVEELQGISKTEALRLKKEGK
jgi:hypothetical protein